MNDVTKLANTLGKMGNTMTLDFEEPKRRMDWVSATHSFVKLLVSAAGIADPVSAAKSAVSAYPTAKQLAAAMQGIEESAPQHLAWTWLSLTLADALTSFLKVLRKDTILQASKLDAAIQEFVIKSLEITDSAKLDENAFFSPASHPAFAQARAQIPHLISKVTLKTKFDIAKWQVVFDDCLAPASFKTIASNHAKLGGLVEAITGPAGTALRRDVAWARHYEWLNKRFYQDAVFSPDGSVTTPLSALYLRLRTYWHEVFEEPANDREEPEKRWKAHFGDLHETVEAWLDDGGKDFLRVVAGGPGSGKSSFARAIAAEIALRGKRRVLFVELQRMMLTGDLYRDIGTYLYQRNKPTGENGSPGFSENPLDWLKGDTRPTLLVFDGLDEITHDSEKSKEISRNFVLNIEKLIRGQNQDGTKICALVLGRDAACQEGMKAAGLPLETMLNVAPIRKLRKEDFYPVNTDRLSEDTVDFPELPDSLLRDQRPEYWKLWCLSQELKNSDPPDAVTHESLSDLNVEPLLLHLLILSDYCGPKWKDAADNRNVVYKDILGQIHQRNVREKKPGQKLAERDFFTLMECLGLAAWRGNLRTGTETTYLAVREIHARAMQKTGQFDHADMDSMVLQTHARKVEGVEPGFEFIHKSFGEYLTARALITLAQRTKRRLQHTEDPVGENVVATEWVDLVDASELTPEILRFVRDEARQITDVADLSRLQSSLQDLLTWTITNGLPAKGESFRAMETIQRCSETALLAVGASISQCLKQLCPEATTLQFGWGAREARLMLNRLETSSERCVAGALTALDFSNSNLSKINIVGANLKYSNFRGARLSQSHIARAKFDFANLQEASLVLAQGYGVTFNGADLSETDMMAAKFYEAEFIGSNLCRANMGNAHLIEANFSGANLRGAKLNYSKLDGASFQDADLAECQFTNASAHSVDFSRSKNLSREALNSMFGVKHGNGLTKLPDGAEYPEFWHTAKEIEDPSREENVELSAAYRRDFEEWGDGHGLGDTVFYIS